MGEVNFFYSPGGQDVYGPVPRETLHGLLRDNIIDSSYYFCVEGATEWQHLSPETLEAAAFEALASQAQTMGPPETQQAPSSVMAERLDSLWSAWVEIMESLAARIFLRAICIIVPPLLGFILVSHYALSLPPVEHSETRILPIAGCFAGILAVTYLFIYLIGVPLPKAYRLWLRASTILLLAVFVVMGWI